MIKKIIIDLDGVVFDTIATITTLYNIDHIMFKDFKPVRASEIKSWEFSELNLETPEFIDRYFDFPKFFEELVLIQGAEWIINKLKNEGFKIIFCSSGSYPNLQLKRKWLTKHFPSCEFVPVEYPKTKDSSVIDAAEGFFIDDRSDNLRVCNAKYKICFGETYDWNEDWDGVRCESWGDVYKYIRDLTKEASMKVIFKNISQVNKFCKAAEKYDGNITVADGSVVVDGESIVGIMTLGLHKTLEVHIPDKFSASAMEFQSAIAALGIER